MSTIDFSRLTAPDYPELINHWKSTAKTPYKRGSISADEINLVLGADTGALNIEFYLRPETRTLEVTLHGYDAGHRVTWKMPMNDVPSDSSVAYVRFVRQAEETLEDGFARRHKRFFITEWKHFVDLFAE